VPKPRTERIERNTASGIGLALPEALQDRDAKSWFKRFEICAVANGWNDEKKLRRLLTLLKDQAWAIFDSLPDESTAHMKEALLSRRSPDTEEDRQSASDKLGQQKLRENKKSIDKLARDIEKLLESASPGLSEANSQAELHYHLVNALPDKVAFQLKVLPKLGYHETISKARELLLLFRCTDMTIAADMSTTAVNHLQINQSEACLRGVKEALQHIHNSSPH